MSTPTTSKLLSELKVTQYDFDPNVDTAVDVGWVDMQDFNALAVGFFRTVGTSALTFLIRGSASSDGSSPQTVKTVTVSSQPDAVGDYIYAEITGDEMKEAGQTLRYASATLTFATSTDEGVVTYVRGHPRRAFAGLTANSVA